MAVTLAAPCSGAAEPRADIKSGPKAPPHHLGAAPSRAARAHVVKLAGCYGRFIAWRDELSTLMLESSSYTPWPTDKTRFDRVEAAFSDGAKRRLQLVIKLEPSFREIDLPPDIRAAFRAGLKTSAGAFAAPRYRNTQLTVIEQLDLSPRRRMAQLEANADEAFEPVAAPCESAAAP